MHACHLSATHGRHMPYAHGTYSTIRYTINKWKEKSYNHSYLQLHITYIYSINMDHFPTISILLLFRVLQSRGYHDVSSTYGLILEILENKSKLCWNVPNIVQDKGKKKAWLMINYKVNLKKRKIWEKAIYIVDLGHVFYPHLQKHNGSTWQYFNLVWFD